MKKLVILIILFLISVSFVSAETLDREKAISWLNEKVTGQEDIQTLSLSILALKDTNYDDKAQSLLSLLESKMSAEGCFPTGACKVDDTAFALLALNTFGKQTQKTVEWLNNAKTTSLTEDWFVQVTTSSTGDCKFSYGKDEVINVEDNVYTSCGDYWIDIGKGKCIDIDFKKEPIKEISVDCSSLDDITTKISLLKQNENNEIYIVEQVDSRSASFTIDNTCWGKTKTSKCDIDSTAYAYWALSEASTIDVPIFLETGANKDVTHYSILYSKTFREDYADWLLEQQSEEGDWGSVYKTAFGVKAGLEDSKSKAIGWLITKQDNSGSFNNRILDTAMVIYATSVGDVTGYIPPETNKTPTTSVGCVNDKDCSTGYCLDEKCVECKKDEDCLSNEKCNLKTYTCEQKISEEDICGDGVCGFYETKESCPDDCKEAFNWLLIVIIFGILIVLGLGGYFGYINLIKKKSKGVGGPSYLEKKGPKTPPATTSVRRVYEPVKRSKHEDYLERELDKSIREAERLLKKK